MGPSRSPSPARTGSGLTVARLETNIRTVYAIELLRWCLITSALETAFFETYGMTASQNAFGLLTYSVTNTLVELPSGWLADTIGRKKILVASALLWGVGYMTHCFGNFHWVLVGECVIALGVSAGSGSDEALIFETVRERMRLGYRASKRDGKELTEDEVGKAVTKVLANMGFCRNISSFTGVILGGVVLRARLQHPSSRPRIA
jgi:MFS family permease